MHWVPLALAPIVARFLRVDKIDLPFVWPPIGDYESLLCTLAAATVALFGVIPLKLRTQAIAARNMKIALGVGSVFVVLYGILLMTVVVPRPTPKNGTVYIAIGFERTDLAKSKFPNVSNDELIKDAGLEQGDIEKLWTASSILLAKTLLFLSYLGAMTSLNYAIGAHERSTPSKK